MGSILSYLTGSSSVSHDRDDRNLLELLDSDDPIIPWPAIERRLQSYPEEAACYAHFSSPSILQRAFVKAYDISHQSGDRSTDSRNSIPFSVVEAFLEAYPDAVFHTDGRGESPLSTAVRCIVKSCDHDSSVNIVSLLLKENPDAIFTMSWMGSQQKLLPLHHVRHSVEVAKILLQAYPEAILHRDAKGRRPLHHACSCRVGDVAVTNNTNTDDNDMSQQLLPPSDPDVIRVLIDAAKKQGGGDRDPYGGVLSKDNKGDTPLTLLCSEVCRVLEEKAGARTNPQEDDGGGSTEDEQQDGGGCGHVLWDSLLVLVRATEVGISKKETTDFRVIHALIQLGCPTPIVSHALTLHPNQVQERDDRGRTPLMMATTVMPRKSPSTVCLLLQAHPDAARMTDDDGRLPIDILSERAESYDKEVFELMVKAEPRAVDTRDLRDRMFPFMTAAVHSNDVNSIYCLLRAKPHVLKYYILDE